MEKTGIEKLNLSIDKEFEVELNKRKIFINKFIEKFPKANLYNITLINKYYTKKNKSNLNFSKNMIREYLSVLN